MKFLNIAPETNIGGHKRSLDDLKYIQDSVFDTVRALGNLVGNANDSVAVIGNFKLVDGGSTFDLLEPVTVIYDNKVFFVNAVTAGAKTVGGAYKFRINNFFGAENPVEYESGSSFNVHVEQTMTLVHTTLSGADYVDVSSATGNAWLAGDEDLFAGFTFAGDGEYYRYRYEQKGKTFHLHIELFATITNDPSGTVIYLPEAVKFKNTGRYLSWAKTTKPAPYGSGLFEYHPVIFNNQEGGTFMALNFTDESPLYTDEQVELYHTLTFEVE